MRFLTILVAALALLYAGYWVVGSIATDRAARAGLDGLRDQGWQVDYAALDTRGFPSRFDTTLTELAITDPQTGIGWRAPFLQAFALSYAPNRVIVVWPDRQEVLLPGQTLTIRSGDIRASAAVAPDTALPLDAVTLEADEVVVASDLGWQAEFASALAAFRDAGGRPGLYDVFAEVRAIGLPQDLRRALDPDGALPQAVDLLRLDAGLGLDRPLDRHAGAAGDAGARIEALTLRDLRLSWGEIALRATGTLAIDRAGLPEGEIAIDAQGWRRVIAGLSGAGLLDPEIARTYLRVGEALVAGDPDDRLSLTLAFRNGTIWAGPVPLGPAPRFR